MAEVSITINGVECKAQEGETILNAARANGIFIPAICYLSRCSPTLACRLCMADVDGKRAYTCNAKVKDGQNIITSTEEIEAERRAIMEVYVVNHPLECGVCDKSGECDLQNYVLELGVREQHFAVANTHKAIENWGVTRYDPSLCIVCERCITVCKDKIGEAALKTVARGEEVAVPKEYKENMSKDAYAVWNKMQKSLIGKNTDENGSTLSCSDCGECASVCPTGALMTNDFHYVSNAWELRKIPASNPHSSDCSLIYYEVKQTSLEDDRPKIYRVSGDKEFAPLNRAARFAYDFDNMVDGKDDEAFKKIVDFIKTRAGTIAFNGFITNEEALILQKIKEKFDLKLVNESAFAYRRFLKAMSESSGNSLCKGSLESVRKSDFIISVGCMIRYDSPNGAYALNNAVKMNKAAVVYAHPIYDKTVQSYSKNLLQLNYKTGSEEAFLYLLLELFAPMEELDEITVERLRIFREKQTVKTDDREVEVEISTLWDKVGVENMNEKISQMKTSKERFSLIIGEDIITHPRWENLAYIIGALERVANFETLIIPPETNSLGAALICDLDEHGEGEVLGYNRAGDMSLSALGSGDLDMPALNQQEGTFTNMDKRVVPTNAALPYFGYELNDIAAALGIESEYTIDYTAKLPECNGFRGICFDELENGYDNDGSERRGYLLDIKKTEVLKTPPEYKDFNVEGDLVYRLNPSAQFNAFVNKASQTKREAALFVSNEFLNSHGLKDGDKVKITSQNGAVLYLRAEEDKNIGGEFAYLPTFDNNLNIYPFFDGYRFSRFFIQRDE